MKLEKKTLTDKVDGFILQRMKKNDLTSINIESRKLLTFNRFDLALKLSYLYLKDKNLELAIEIYRHDIRSQTLEGFKELGNEKKNSFQVYIDYFEDTFNSICKSGFDESKSLIPLSKNGFIMNGAHRVASAIFCELPVQCVLTGLDDVSPDYRYFIERNVPEHIMDIGAKTFCEYSVDTFIAFLWPSGRKNYQETEMLFDRVIYKKDIMLNSNGGLNLLVELYKHMDWVGDTKNNFSGAHQKLLECFTDFDLFTVILFQSESLEKVQEVKKKVRDINGIGFSSIHITDTKEEAERISKLVFDKNGLHFLNYAKPYKYSSTLKMIKSVFPSIARPHYKDLVLDGSMTLSVYGLREARDIDYLSEELITNPECSFDLESHDSQLLFHEVEKRELIYNPKYYFEYLGIKFISFDQTYKFKNIRNEKKDINDCQMMVSMIEKNSFGFFIANLKQNLFYKKLIIKNRVRELAFLILKKTRTYNAVRTLYRKLKGRT